MIGYHRLPEDIFTPNKSLKCFGQKPKSHSHSHAPLDPRSRNCLSPSQNPVASALPGTRQALSVHLRFRHQDPAPTHCYSHHAVHLSKSACAFDIKVIHMAHELSTVFRDEYACVWPSNSSLHHRRQSKIRLILDRLRIRSSNISDPSGLLKTLSLRQSKPKQVADLAGKSLFAIETFCISLTDDRNKACPLDTSTCLAKDVFNSLNRVQPDRKRPWTMYVVAVSSMASIRNIWLITEHAAAYNCAVFGSLGRPSSSNMYSERTMSLLMAI